jgi:hypothetical protein
MPEADISLIIGYSKARIQGSKENSAACASYPYADLGFDAISQGDRIEEIFNKATASVKIREFQSSALLWTLSETGSLSPVIAPSESKIIGTSLNTDVVAVLSWTTPVATTDYLPNTKSDGTGTDVTSDISISVSSHRSISASSGSAVGQCLVVL